MKFKIYIIGRKDEELYKNSFSTLDGCIEDIERMIPNVISRKLIDVIIIRRKEE